MGGYAFSCCWSLTIYAEAQGEKEGWNAKWNDSKLQVVWGYIK